MVCSPLVLLWHIRICCGICRTKTGVKLVLVKIFQRTFFCLFALKWAFAEKKTKDVFKTILHDSWHPFLKKKTRKNPKNLSTGGLTSHIKWSTQGVKIASFVQKLIGSSTTRIPWNDTKAHIESKPSNYEDENAWAFTYLLHPPCTVLLPESPFAMMDTHTHVARFRF